MIVKKGLVMPEYGRTSFRVNKETKIIQKPWKGKLKEDTCESVLKEYKECKSKRGKRRLWEKYLRLKKREERLFKETDPVKIKILEAIHEKNKVTSFYQKWTCFYCKKENNMRRRSTSIGKRVKSTCQHCNENQKVLVKKDE